MGLVKKSTASIRRHLTYANAMATVAMFIALGGGAYAATTLPRNSVDTAQLRRDAVIRSKLADRSVGTAQLVRNSVRANRLSKGVREQIDRASKPGAQGPTGPAGPRGADGPGARRLHYDAPATATPEARTVFDIPGLRMRAACVQQGADVQVGFRLTPSEDGLLHSNFTLDSGADPASPPPPGDPAVATGNAQTSLVANADNDVGGPGTQRGYVRAIANAIVAGENRTFTLNLVELANADTGRCRITGTVLPST